MKWEDVAGNPKTQRLRVDSGWLYLVHPMHHEPTVAFVPFYQAPTAQMSPHQPHFTHPQWNPALHGV